MQIDRLNPLVALTLGSLLIVFSIMTVLFKDRMLKHAKKYTFGPAPDTRIDMKKYDSRYNSSAIFVGFVFFIVGVVIVFKLIAKL